MSSSDIAVSVRGLSKAYTIAHDQEKHITLAETLLARLKNPLRKPKTETFWALKDVDFEINKGDVVGIIGRNGAGKSTLLKVLSRITEPTRGEIDIYGRVGSLLEVGTGFHPELTGRENIYLNGAILGMTKGEISRKFDEIVDFAGVEQFLDTPVKRYSSGMYVRLAFAVAANLASDILIIDEVLAVGDADFQKKCLGKMSEVSAQEGRTVLFVSHNSGAVRSLCKSGLWLANGQIKMFGTANDVTDAYFRSGMSLEDQRLDCGDIKRGAPGLGERLRITSIEFNGGEPIIHAEPLTIKMKFETHTPLEDVTLGIGFCTSDGTRLFSLDSDLVVEAQNISRPGPGILEGRIARMDLQPGRYVLDIGARSGDNSGLDWLPSFAQVDILPGPSTHPAIIRHAGGVRQPADWTWTTPSSIAQNTTAELERSFGI